jgi:type IVB pilus formation R64 PilN family outer membrane protein
MIYKRIALLLLTISFIVTGCESPAIYNQTENNAADVKGKVNDAMHASNAAGKKEAPLLINQGLYVDKTPINLAREPAWLRNRIILRGGELPFAYYSRTIIGGNGHLLVQYQTGIDQTLKTALTYSGTVKGALDLLASKTGYVYSVNGNHIIWQAFVTKTFDIAFMPGTADYTLGDTSGSTTTSTTSGGGTGTTTGGITNGVNQSSSLKGTLSIWKDLEDTIKTLASPDGKVLVSQATTSVTVRDKPANIALVSKYIENMNKTLSKQVLIKIQVLSVTLNNDFNYGIDWSIVQSAFGGSNAVLNANYGTPVSITPLGGAAVPQAGLQIMNTGRTTGFTILVNALKEQGKVAVVTEPRVVCLNNQVSVINIVEKTGYAASVSSTALAGGSGSNGSSVTSSITPGTVVTGLVLYVLPKIMGDKVYLDVNADVSSLVILQTFTSGTGGASPASIQVPTTTEKEFNQRSVIGSGDTLILSGLRQVTNQTGAMQFLDSQALGGKAATENDQETIVLITPIILNRYA